MKTTPQTHGNLEHGAKLSRRFFAQSGQSLVEFALLTPILVLLVLGVVEMGRYAYLSIVLGNSAEAGAMYGAQSIPQSSDPTGIQNAALNDFQNGQSLPGLTVTSSTACGCDSGGTMTSAGCNTTTNPTAGTCGTGHWIVTVQVTASATFSSLFTYPGIPPSLTVTRMVTMRVKQV